MTKNYHMMVSGNCITVDKTRLDLYAAIQWTKQNCPHYITNQYHGNYHGNDLIDFFFIDSDQARKEMTWFMLRWS